MASKSKSKSKSKAIEKLARIRSNLLATGRKYSLNEARKSIYLLNYKTSDKQVVDFYKQLLPVPRIKRELLQDQPNSYKTFDIGLVQDKGDIERELLLLTIEFIENINLLNVFVTFKSDYIKSFFASDFEKAETALNNIERECGVSLWLLEARFALLQEKGGLESQKKYLKQILDKQDMPVNLQYFAYMYSQRVEKNLTWDNFENSLKQTTKNVSNDTFFKDYIIFKLKPLSAIQISKLPDIVSFEKNTSVVDRYLTFKYIAMNLLWNAKSINSEVLKVQFRTLRSYIEDFELKNVLSMTLGDEIQVKNDAQIKVDSIIEAYTEGNYNRTMEIFEQLLNEKPYTVNLYDLYVKARIKEDKIIFSEKENGIKRKIQELILESIMKSRDCKEIYNDFIKLGSMYHHHGWGNQLLAFFAEEDYYLNIDSELSHIMFYSILESGLFTFKKYNNLPCNLKRCLNAALDHSSEKATDKLFSIYESPTKEKYGEIDSLDLPSYRLNNYKGNISLKLGLYDEAISQFKDLLDFSKADYKYTHEFQRASTGLCKALRLKGDFDQYIDSIADCLLGNDFMYVLFNIKDIVKFIVEEYNGAQMSESVPIILDIYNKYISNDKESELKESYEDFLDFSRVHRPSMLKDKFDQLDRERLVYFLSKICTISIMSASGMFQRYKDVCNERIAICQLLSEIDADNLTIYQQEITEITKNQKIEEGLRIVDESKIFVNVEGIRNSLKGAEESFSRLKDLLSTSVYDQILKTLLELGNSASKYKLVNFGVDECESLLKKLTIEIRDEFVSSNKHGLDGYISVGIRHGTLLAKLRTPLQNESLITKRNKDTGIYSEATFWEEEYKHCTERSRKNIINRLSEFSKQVDGIIEYMRDILFQINTEKKPTDGLFKFNIDSIDFNSLRSKIKEDTSFNDFFEMVIDILWEIAGDNLTEIRQVIENEIKTRFNDTFNNLVKDVQEILEPEYASKLENKIYRLRTNLFNELDGVAKWFQLSKTARNAPYDISLPIEINIAILKNLSKEGNIRILPLTSDKITLRGDTLQFFVNIVAILFDNAIQYNMMDKGQMSDVLIKASDNDEFITLDFRNKLSGSYDKVKGEKDLSAINEKLNTSSNFMEQVRYEGGSGFSKIKKMIEVDLKSRAKIGIEITDDYYFVVEISISKEGIIE